MNTPRNLTRTPSLLGALALLAFQGGVHSASVAHAGVEPARASSAAHVAPAAEAPGPSLPSAALPTMPAATVADMQLSLAGFMGRVSQMGRGVIVEDTLCGAAGSEDCGARFTREVAAHDPALATALAPEVARVRGEATGLRVTAWRTEGEGATARGAITLQGLRRGHVTGLVVYR